MKNLKIILTCVLLLSVLFSCGPKKKHTYLYTIIKEGVKAKTFENEPVIWTAEIKIDSEFLKSKTISEFELKLEDKKEVTIIRNFSKEVNGITKWHGEVKDDPGSLAIFVLTKDNTLAANITLASSEFYKIRYLSNGKFILAKIDSKKYPADAPAIKVEKEIPIEMDPCPNTDPAHSIDVMVVYTDDARSASGNTSSMLSEIYLAVEETNMAYINSNITQRINLVHTSEVSYTETNNASDDIAALQSTTDGILDNIHSLRDNHSADLVVLIAENIGGPCGIAYVMETVSTAFEPYAFAVVDRGCATGSYSFAHELGHNMGARHDCDNTPGLLPYDYAHGYYDTSPTPVGQANWRTVMSYNPTPSAARICYFSNPGVTYPPGATDGDPMGVTDIAGNCQSDNHLTLNNTAISVANFRCTGSGINNVWMKDTWNDTGAEPDPNTTSESMCRSPYTWVRNEQDTNLVHHHQHQNAITGIGVNNWVYVKLHNGGPAISGDLEVYFADASISLSWPTGWTLIDDKTLTIDANSTEIAEFEWTNLPSSGGHYCLVARWDSTADPMHTPEGTSIGANIRENNNLIWKNITIIDLPPPSPDYDKPVSAYFHFNKISKDSFIRIKCIDDYPNKAFTRYGKLKIEFDKKSQMLLKNWKGSDGIVRKGNAFIIKKSLVELRKFPFDIKHSGKIKITFQSLKDTPKRIYYLHVSNMTTIKNKVTEIGSVAFEIDTQLNRKILDK